MNNQRTKTSDRSVYIGFAITVFAIILMAFEDSCALEFKIDERPIVINGDQIFKDGKWVTK